MASGIVIIDKPSGWTSMDVCAKIRGILKEKRVGHGGTLDPMATGVLPVFCGGASKAVDLQLDHTKTYCARLKLGLRTDTGDITGTVLETAPVTAGEKELLAVLPRFLGPQMQTPPMYSAVKINGQPLYKLAREGVTVERKARPIEILDIRYGGSPVKNEYVLTVRCSKGTYVRTLCHDLGSALGCGGCMSSLRRTRAGSFTLSQAVTMQQVLDFAAEHDPQELLMPVDAVFSVHPPLIVTLGQAAKLKNGAQVRDWQFRSGTYRVYAEDGEFLLLGRVENGLLTTIKSFFEVNTLAT